MAKAFTIGAKMTTRALGILGKDMPKDVADSFRPFLEEARTRMRNRIDGWDSVKIDNELKDSIIIRGPTKGKKGGYNLILRSEAPYSRALETGVTKHILHRGHSPKAAKWIDMTFGPKVDAIWVGASTNSRIRKGQSRRKFFSPVVKEMSTDKLDKTIKDGFDKSFKKFRKAIAKI